MLKIVLNQYTTTGMKLDIANADIYVGRPNKGSSSKSLMGGQYLLVGIGGCFCSTLFATADSRHIEIKGLKVEVSGVLEQAPKRFKQVNINVTYEYSSQPEDMNKLLLLAERGCISINSIKKETVVTIKTN